MTPYRNFAAMLAVLGLIAYACVPPSHAATLGARTSDMGGVLVVVQPRTNAPIDGKWEFNVAMNTHSKPLTVDVAHAAVLIDDTGQRVTAATWQGDAPGGHHRKGVLQFPFKGAKPKSIEVQIKGVGGSETRTFKWQLN